MELPMKRLVAVLILTLTLAFAAAGCGGSEPSAEEEWADDVCTSLSDWQDQIKKSAADVREQIRSPGADTLAAIESEIQEAADATNELADDLESLEPPDTEGADQAKQELDALATQLDSTVTNTKETIDSLPEGASLSEIAKAVAPLLPSLQALATSATNALTLVKETGSELKTGFEQADSCERYR
jgi:septal ring factor EnvC (AmiA/AmiB activator)